MQQPPPTDMQDVSFRDLSETIMTRPVSARREPTQHQGAVPKMPSAPAAAAGVDPNDPQGSNVAQACEDPDTVARTVGDACQEIRTKLDESISRQIQEGLLTGFAQIREEVTSLFRENRATSNFNTHRTRSATNKETSNNFSNRGKENNAVFQPPVWSMPPPIVPHGNYPNENRSTDNNVPREPYAREFQPHLPKRPESQGSNAPSSQSNGREILNSPPDYPPTSVKLDRWGVIFDGNQEKLSVEDFIFRVEYLQFQHRCCWSDIIRDFHMLLAGDAREWYWLYVKTNCSTDWATLRYALLLQYKTSRSEHEKMQDLRERKQRLNEPIDAFFHAVLKLRSRVSSPLPVYSVEQLREECHDAERWVLRRDTRAFQQPYFTRRVSEIESPQLPSILGPSDSEHWVVEEIESRVPEKASEETEQSVVDRPTCWNCRRKGHVFMECLSQQRNIFCYKCGLADVITPKCPKCTGNVKRIMADAGKPCSSQQPAIQK